MSEIERLRHSAAHVLGAAVLRLWPEAQLDIGPPIKDGFYYDFELPISLKQEDLEKIETQMRAIIKENQKFERVELSREQAERRIEQLGQTRFKLDRLKDIPESATISFYKNGEFEDLCAGSHVRYTKQIKAFKLLSIAGAYHRGDANEAQLQRIYGTAFASKAELEAHLQRLKDAELRDHRKIGKAQKLFTISESVGQGLVLWQPNGMVLRRELQAFIMELLDADGYEQVATPHIGKLELYAQSGHFPYYQDSQFAPLPDKGGLLELAAEGCSCTELSARMEQGDLDGYLLKPMNCPMHIALYQSSPRSYRELPVRLAEFGTVYRWEQSGELNGLVRARGFTQDDAHIFCTPEQLSSELASCLKLVRRVFTTLGMHAYRVRIGVRGAAGDGDASNGNAVAGGAVAGGAVAGDVANADASDGEASEGEASEGNAGNADASEGGSSADAKPADKYIGSPELWDAAESALRTAVEQAGLEHEVQEGQAAFYGPKIDFVLADALGRDWQLGTIQVDYNLPQRFKLKYTGADNQTHQPVMIHRAPLGSIERFIGILIEQFAGDFPVWLSPEQVRILPLGKEVFDYAEELSNALKQRKIRHSIDKSSDKLGAKIRRAELEKTPYSLIIGAKERDQQKVAVRSRVSTMPESMDFQAFLQAIQKSIQARELPQKPPSKAQKKAE